MTTSPTTKMARILRKKRNDRGMSMQDVRDELLGYLPKRYVPSISKLSRMETGHVDEKLVDGMVINALSHVYGCRISELSPTVADEMERVRDLLVRSSRWNNGPLAADEQLVLTLAGV